MTKKMVVATSGLSCAIVAKDMIFLFNSLTLTQAGDFPAQFGDPKTYFDGFALIE